MVEGLEAAFRRQCSVVSGVNTVNFLMDEIGIRSRAVYAYLRQLFRDDEFAVCSGESTAYYTTILRAFFLVQFPFSANGVARWFF